MASPDKKIEVAIIGGGFAGLTLAIGLQKYDHLNVNVYEGAHKFAEIGAGVVLGPNAQRAMLQIDPKVHQAYERRAAFTEESPDEHGNYAWMTINRGKEPDSMQLVTQLRYPMRASTIHRAHFLDELVKLVKPDSAHFGKRLDRIYESDDVEDPIVLHFKDGTTVEADVVLGCDGIHSVTRKHVLGPNDPAANATFVGSCAYRAIVPIEKAKEVLGSDLRGGGNMYAGRNGIVVGFPLAGNTLWNLGVTCFDIGPWQHNEWIVQADVGKVKAFYKDWDPWIQKNVNLLPETSTQEWSIWDMPPARTYCKGKIAIVGDAAHATSPFQGSGAGQAIEDSLVLSELLGRLLDPNHSRSFPPTAAKTIPVVLETYDVVRRFRSQKVCVTSREMGRIMSGTEPGVGESAKEMRDRLGDRLRWIWDYDQEGQVHDAFLLFEQLRGAAERSSLQHPA